MADTVIREVTPGVWIFSRPFLRFGLVPVGGRSTAIQLQNGDVWVLASTALNEETKSKLHELGPVKYIMAADAVHSGFISEFKAEYPDAKVIGVAPLLEKRKDIKWDGAYGADPPDTKYGFEPEIQACHFPKHANQDVAFLHVPSKTLMEADLLFNLPAKEQYSKTATPNSIGLRLASFGPESRLHKRLAYSISSDKAAMKRDAQTVAGWDFDRIIPCHGDVIEKDGKHAWTAAYEWVLNA